ncbi:CDP-alcohol phosphatidyltransferase family protein [Methylophilaceae bacterium Uisw_099_01]
MTKSHHQKKKHIENINLEKISSLYGGQQLFIEKIVDKFSFSLAKLIYLYTNISANQLSILRLFIVMISGIFVLQEEYFYRIIGLFLLIVATVLDFTDGKLAKLNKNKTKLGGFLEDFGDFFTTFYSLVCLTIYANNNLNYDHDYLFILVIATYLFLLKLSAIFDKIYSESKFKKNGNANFGFKFKNTINKILMNIVYPKSQPYSLFFTIRYLFLFGLLFDKILICLSLILFFSFLRTFVMIYVYVKSLSKNHEIARNLKRML